MRQCKSVSYRSLRPTQTVSRTEGVRRRAAPGSRLIRHDLVATFCHQQPLPAPLLLSPTSILFVLLSLTIMLLFEKLSTQKLAGWKNRTRWSSSRTSSLEGRCGKEVSPRFAQLLPQRRPLISKHTHLVTPDTVTGAPLATPDTVTTTNTFRKKSDATTNTYNYPITCSYPRYLSDYLFLVPTSTSHVEIFMLLMTRRLLPKGSFGKKFSIVNFEIPLLPPPRNADIPAAADIPAGPLCKVNFDIVPSSG